MNVTEKITASTATAAPSIGPAVVTFLGSDVPILALVLSGSGLLLARMIAPPPLRKLSRSQHVALTALLLIALFVLVTGEVTGETLRPGMAFVCGIGLGFSGIVAVELFAERAMAAIRALLGKSSD